MSSGKFSDRSSVMTYRQFYAERWQSVIKDNFESVVDVAFHFKVDPSTAQNWWDGSNAPQGWVVGYALHDPDLRDSIMNHLAVG